MKFDFTFKGMMVPVFTPFMDDKKRTVNYDMIDKYGHLLKTMGMHGVMVNGMTGEGMTLTMDERKKLTEKWMEVTRKYDLKMLLNIGGTGVADIYELAEHAEKLKVDAVMLMPDTFYKPRTEKDLVMYLKDITTYMPTRPMFYYHIPMMTDVYVDMFNFMYMMDKEVTTFTGLFYADDKMDKLIYLKKKFSNYTFIAGLGLTMMGFMAEGIDAISMTSMNLYPDMIKELYDFMIGYKMQDAHMVREKMYKRMYDLFEIDSDKDWLTMMKMEMDKMYPTLKMGPMRKPKMSFNKLWMGKM